MLSTTSLTDRKVSVLPTRETTSLLLINLFKQRPLVHPIKTQISSRIRMNQTAPSRHLHKDLKEVLTNVQATHSPARHLVKLRITELMCVSRTHLKVAFLETQSLRMPAASVLVELAQELQIFLVMTGPITNAAITTT